MEHWDSLNFMRGFFGNGIRRQRFGGGSVLLEMGFLLFNLAFLVIVLQKLIWAEPPEKVLVPGAVNETVQSSAGPSRMNILCLGVDSVDGTHRTDTVLLMGIDPASRKLHGVSIPRDTRVLIEGKARKINEIMARHGITALRNLLEELLEIRVDRHVKVDFQGFVKIIDLIGGVDLDIEHAMNYDDFEQDLHIHLPAGPQKLDGKKALEFVRFRSDASADLGRIKRQQKFIAAVLQALKSPEQIMRIPELVREALANIETDLTVAEVVDLARVMLTGPMKVQTESLPGEARYVDKVSYFLPYKDQAVALGARGFSNLSLLDIAASFTVAPASGTAP